MDGTSPTVGPSPTALGGSDIPLTKKQRSVSFNADTQDSQNEGGGRREATESQRPADDPPKQHSRRKWIKPLSMELENKGSVARDHLASERTWLAYVRTSLTVASAGVALVQLFAIDSVARPHNFLRYARPLGAVTVSISFLILVVGLWRYFAVQKALTSGQFAPAGRIVFVISVLMGLVTGVIFGFLVATRPR